MKTFLVFMLTLLTMNAEAALKRYFQDPKWPVDKSIKVQTIDNPAAAGTADVLSAHAGNTSAAAASAATFVAQPDVPRNLVITPGSTTADVAACIITVTGLDIQSKAITETFTFTNNQSTAVTGAKAFKSISLVSFPASCEDGAFSATWSIGYGEKLGIPRCLDNAGDILFSLLNGSKEATAPTIVKDASVVSKNTADYNGTMNGSNDFVLYYFENYAQSCQP